MSEERRLKKSTLLKKSTAKGNVCIILKHLPPSTLIEWKLPEK